MPPLLPSGSWFAHDKIDRLATVANESSFSDSALGRLYVFNPGLFKDMMRRYGPKDMDVPTFVSAVESYASSGNVAEFNVSRSLAYQKHTDRIKYAARVLAEQGFELTSVAAAVSVVRSAANGDVIGVLVNGVEFFPVGKVARLIGGAADLIRNGTRVIDANDADVIADTIRTATNRASDLIEAAGRLGGELYSPQKLRQLEGYLAKRGIKLKVGDGFLPPNGTGAFDYGKGELLLKSNPTSYEVWHELSHYLHYRKIGAEAYSQLPRSVLNNVPEQFVFDMLENSKKRWGNLNDAQRRHAIYYIERVGGLR